LSRFSVTSGDIRGKDGIESGAARSWPLPVWLLIAVFFLAGFGYVASSTTWPFDVAPVLSVSAAGLAAMLPVIASVLHHQKSLISLARFNIGLWLRFGIAPQPAQAA
jgi:hypothetical protein